LAGEAIIKQEEEIMANSQRKIWAAKNCIFTAYSKKGAQLNSDQPLEVSKA
jgi:hypothetical protein